MFRNEQNRTTFAEFCEVSTCMGVVDWYNAKTMAGKLFWAIMLTVSLGVTIWQTQGIISQFFNESPYKTTVSKQMVDGGVEYPNLTICNYNRAKQSLINETNLDTKILIYLFQLFPVNYNFPLFVTPNLNITEYENEWIKFKKKTRVHDPKDVFRFYSHNSTETITMVTSENGIPLTLEYEDVWTVHGLCWKLIPKKKQIFAGAAMSIKFILNPMIKEYMTDTLINNYAQEGLVILPNYINEPLMPTPLYIAPGICASIALTATEYRAVQYETPLRPPKCRASAVLTILNETYTPSNCFFDCYLISIWKKCGCVLLANTYPNYSLCNLTMAVYCASQIASLNLTITDFTKSRSLQVNNITKNVLPDDEFITLDQSSCMSSCDVPCDNFRTVTASMTTTNAVSRHLKNAALSYLNANSGFEYDEDFLDNIIFLDMFFATPEITIIETGETTPIFTFIGNVGGQLGLWVGVSMLTLIQTFYYIFLACLRGEIWSFSKKRVWNKSSRIKEIQLNLERSSIRRHGK